MNKLLQIILLGIIAISAGVMLWYLNYTPMHWQFWAILLPTAAVLSSIEIALNIKVKKE